MSIPSTPLRDLVEGQSVHHSKFGAGRVVSAWRKDGREFARVDFGLYGVRDLDVNVAQLDDAASRSRRSMPWEALVDTSVALEPLGRERWLAWFGPAVANDEAALLQALTAGLADPQPHPVGRSGQPAKDWPDVVVLLHPSTARRNNMALGGVVAIHWQPDVRFAAAFPFYTDWSHSHRFTPRRICACPHRIEVVVEGDLHVGSERLAIAYGAPTFDLGCAFLNADSQIQLALTALAYECGPATERVMTVKHAPEVIEELRGAGVDVGQGDDGAMAYRLDGMSVWLPNPRRGDLVSFRGRVAEVHQIELPSPPRAAWKLRLRAWQVDDGEWLLDVVFEATVWQGTDAPQVGDDVRGSAWLMGECLGPANAARREPK